ncbi:MAG: hypothetical protein AB8E82_12850 [Aureispira sp.]
MIPMYRLLILLFCLASTSCFLTSCTTDNPSVSNIEVHPCAPRTTSEIYNNASLQNYTYSQGKMMFNPQNIRLGGQVTPIASRPMTRSNKGLHLHVSVNNQQHQLSNENIFEYPLEDGQYDLFAFLADSYYESIKTPNAIMGRQIEIRNGLLAGSRPFEQIALLYNIPIGTHEINKSDSILLDFVLYGTQLGEQGNYVSMVINQQEAIQLDKWQPYYLTGFTEGSHQITLTLNNAEGRTITPPVSHTFTVKTAEK